MDKETDMLTEQEIVEFEQAAEANPEFVEKIKAAAAQPGIVRTPEEFNAWLDSL